jgi:HicA toxin of bacterial toxin-antitoxin,
MIIELRSKHQRTIDAIFSNPIRSDIIWKDVEQMLISLGAEIREGHGSRVRIVLNKQRAVFHRPHPGKEMNKGAVRSLRLFLMNAEVKLC